MPETSHEGVAQRVHEGSHERRTPQWRRTLKRRSEASRNAFRRGHWRGYEKGKLSERKAWRQAVDAVGRIR